MCGYTHHGDEAPDVCPQCGASKAKFYRERQESKWNTCNVSLIAMILAGLILTYFLFCSCRSTTNVDNTTVKAVDLNRYLGKWYEIARFDHRFERGMVQCTAIYSLRENGKITVMNRGMRNGQWKTSVGKAKVTDVPGVLRVSFFGPFYSDYRIMMLAPDYTYALVGGDGDDYLWILSRTPQLKPETHDLIIREAKRRGYRTEDLIWVEQ